MLEEITTGFTLFGVRTSGPRAKRGAAPAMRPTVAPVVTKSRRLILSVTLASRESLVQPGAKVRR